jgi:NAD-dependent dihydropyrimidine dehydrogenase PreA subunit
MAGIMRDIVRIDEDLCDGCGDCVPSCAEGAIKIVNGKAKLVAENLCDGIGACLGVCPKGAITIEKRAADPFDEQAVASAKAEQTSAELTDSAATPCASGHSALPFGGSCPGSRARKLSPKPSENDSPGTSSPTSQLSHWPVQLALVPPVAPFLRNREILLAADCGPFAIADFHNRFIKDRAVLVGCPKLDNLEFYRQKLVDIFRQSECTGLTVVTMEVPCCLGLKMIALEALRLSGKSIPVREVVLGLDGTVRSEKALPESIPV